MTKNNPQVVLITGCSSGFGLLTAARLASLGHKVYASMRNPEKKDSLLSEVHKRGGELKVLRLDVTKKESIKEAVSSIAHQEGHLDVLVNNAGFGIGGFFEDMSEEEIRDQMETNFFGVQNVIREVIPLMRPRKKGKIINISSVSGFSAYPGFSAYIASKHALEGYTETLYHELALFNIKVANINPGIYRTKFFEENARYASKWNDPQSPYYRVSQNIYQLVMNNVRQSKRDPEDIARLVEEIMNTANPAFHYFPDLQSKATYLVRKIFPFSWYSALMRQVFFDKVK